MSRTTTADLVGLARRARRLALAAIFHARSGHPGGVLSCIDLLAWLGASWYRDAPPNGADGGEQLVLSKGHACPALYAVGAELGWIDAEEVLRLRKLGSPCQGHTHVVDLPWVGASTGSLGQGVSVAVGKAVALRHRELAGHVTVVAGDGELQEGEVWEAAMFAAHHGLGNLTLVVDYNKLQSDDANANICGLEPLADKWRAFGWSVHEADGHDFASIGRAMSTSREEPRPTAVIAHTVKGKGVPAWEGEPLWHGSVTLSAEQLADALRALDTPEGELEGWLRGEVPHSLADEVSA